ncbi:MAG: TfoX C-terminal domain [Rhodobacteraceae bacterium HLUCCA12]|nr:MAG: TfoX C-terminal domain [Rhodobacteraceae bacterium HLUCCA12]
MSEPISTIRNLGPATEAAFHRAGIHSAEALRAMGADNAYAALLRAGERAHFIAYYVLVMGLQGRPWNDCTGDEKVALRRRFDALKAAHATKDDRSGLEAILDRIGVVPARPQPPAERR